MYFKLFSNFFGYSKTNNTKSNQISLTLIWTSNFFSNLFGYIKQHKMKSILHDHRKYLKKFQILGGFTKKVRIKFLWLEFFSSLFSYIKTNNTIKTNFHDHRKYFKFFQLLHACLKKSKSNQISLTSICASYSFQIFFATSVLRTNNTKINQIFMNTKIIKFFQIVH